MVRVWGDDARALAPGVTVLIGAANGAYPSGNSLVVAGAGETVVIDPSVTLVEKGGVGIPVDAVVNSHGHEDHMAGNGTYPDARVHIHHADLLAARGLDGLMEVYGYAPDAEAEARAHFRDEFHYSDRPDATGFGDGHVFDLGGVTVEAVHLPGHTRGHSGFRISGGVFFLSDIDLTGFGPYYGDVWSDLEDFEASLRQVREEDAAHYVTFHQKGVIDGRDRFLRRRPGRPPVHVPGPRPRRLRRPGRATVCRTAPRPHARPRRGRDDRRRTLRGRVRPPVVTARSGGGSPRW